jgi:hypothetical protein
MVNNDAPRHISFPDARHAQHLAEGSVLGLQRRGVGGSIPTLLTGRFRLLPFLATLPLSLPVTWLFPSGNCAYRLARPVEG